MHLNISRMAHVGHFRRIRKWLSHSQSIALILYILLQLFSTYTHADSNTTLDGLSNEMDLTQSQLLDAINAMDSAWIYVTSFLIFFMQAGFALLEAGAVGSKDIISILLKNFADFGISSIMYWMVGYGIHYGTTPFIGGSSVSDFATDHPTDMAKLLTSTMFCATAVTIVSGAIACRFSFHAYMILCVVFSGFIYPVTAGWIWGHGFLSPTKLGAIDFAGSGVVHFQGATIAMTACLFVGPRIGRFILDPVTGKVTPSSDFNGNSIVLTALGTLILWFGWYGFNPGSTGGLSGGRYLVAGIAAVNTTLAASTALMTGLVLTRFMEKSYNFWDVLNSTLAGLVAITAACATVGPAPAMAIGVLAAITYHFTNKFVLSLGIDDVVGAFSVHGTPGVVGLLCTGLFSRQDYIDLAFGVGVIHHNPGRQLGVQLLFAICVFAWSAGASSIVLFILTRTIGIRVSEDDEIVGLDFKYHQGYAYETHNKRMLRAKKQIEREQILGQKMRNAVGVTGTNQIVVNGAVAKQTLFRDQTPLGSQQGGAASMNDVSLQNPLTGNGALGSGQHHLSPDQGSVPPSHMLAIDEGEDSRSRSEASGLQSQGSYQRGSAAAASAAQHSRQRSQIRITSVASPTMEAGVVTNRLPLQSISAQGGSGRNLLRAADDVPNQSIPDHMPGQSSEGINNGHPLHHEGGGIWKHRKSISRERGSSLGGTSLVGKQPGANAGNNTRLIHPIHIQPSIGDRSLLRHVSPPPVIINVGSAPAQSSNPSVLELMSSGHNRVSQISPRSPTSAISSNVAAVGQQSYEESSNGPTFHTEYSQNGPNVPPSPLGVPSSTRAHMNSSWSETQPSPAQTNRTTQPPTTTAATSPPVVTVTTNTSSSTPSTAAAVAPNPGFQFRFNMNNINTSNSNPNRPSPILESEEANHSIMTPPPSIFLPPATAPLPQGTI